VEISSRWADLLGDRVHEGCEVVMRLRFDLGDSLWRGCFGAASELTRVLCRDDSEFNPCVGRGQLDFEPTLKLGLFRPDSVHGRTRVPFDHARQSSLWAGLSPE